MAGTKNKIPSFKLDKKYFFIHKEDVTESDFGTDNTPELIDQGFGIYSSKMVRSLIGPLKSQFYRIGFCRKGTLEVDFGLETFKHEKDTIHFNYPGQLFSLKNASKDMLSYYLLFSADFMEDIYPSLTLRDQYPFLDYGGAPFFKLSKNEAQRTEELFVEIDKEVRNGHSDKGQAIKHYIDLILIEARRSYVRQGLSAVQHHSKPSSLVVRFKKLVGQHFIKIRNVAEYAAKLGVTAKHLGKNIKEETGATASSFIDEMLMMEIKALLRHSDLSISEIADHLDFSDHSHFTTFFKKHKGVTPLQYRKETS